MNIVIFIHSLSSGGAERVTSAIANHLVELGWRVAIATIGGKEEDFYPLREGVERIVIGSGGGSASIADALLKNIRCITAYRAVLRERRPNVALAMMPTTNVRLALATIGLPWVRTIGSERAHPPELSIGRAWSILRSLCYWNLSVVVALASESASWLYRHTSCRRVAVIPNPAVWPLQSGPPHLPVPREFVNKRILLAVGRLSEQKQHLLLIRAFKELAQKFEDWVLVIIGEGPLRPELEAGVECMGLKGRVYLPGRAGNISDWYAAADLFVLVSKFEGFPNALVEAMAHGVPAVSFDCDTGPRDIIRHGLDGILVPQGDEVALERSLETLMKDEVRRNALASMAAEVRIRFSEESVMRQWESILSGR